MKVLFIIDRIELKYFEFNNLVTNFWLIKELLERDVNVDIATIDNLGVQSNKAYVNRRKTYLKEGNIFNEKEMSPSFIENYDLVIFRPDPPVDIDYINATYVFDFLDKSKTKIINSPEAIRNFNEKFHALKYSHLMPENIVTSSKNDILEFLNKHKKIILKPLNACFGAGVMMLSENDLNTNSIINSMTNNSTRLIMVQKYLENAKLGDKRVLFLNGEVLDYCIQKLPGENDFKFNEHCDKNIIRATLTQTEKEKFTPIAKELNSKGYSISLENVKDVESLVNEIVRESDKHE